DPEHQHIEDLKRKSFFLMAQADPQLIESPELLDEVLSAFKAAARLNRFITESLGLPF
ncbi:MAG: hypothetical protein ACI9CB_001975, partial [Rhodothermales bacterium]